MTPKSNAPSVDPHIVGNAFVHKYYNQLYESPAEVYKFYLEDSLLSRPGLDGLMVSVKSLNAIKDQILSVDYKSSKIQILTADSQPSLKDGVVTHVTGLVIESDGKRRKFCQSFFLVAQNGSYFVLNDTFRFVFDESVEPEATKEVEESPQVIESTDIITEPANEIVEVVIAPTHAKTTVTKPASDISNGHVKVPEEKVVNRNTNLPKAAEAELQEETPKKSFASIVQSLGQNNGQFHVKASPAKPKRVQKPNVAPEPKAPSQKPEQASIKTIEQSAQGGSIFVANLPMDATTEQLFEAFKDFGAIRKDGIQVRSYTETRNCFGFVAFENGEVIKNVLKAHKESPIRIGNRRASIEEKRGGNNNPNGSRSFARYNGNSRNENGYRNDGYKPRGNGVNGGRGHGRRNNEADGGKAHQNNGHDNAQAKN